ncbi:MAG: GNAT family N-acetyltransferase [Caldilineaceae bacterium]|nr:GNAT family N-acetyltransferase [Caldilineaceae bacterium]MCB0188808.1 GNAT family N-acetyltransferase [Caldilineaceae bacterium]
MQWTLTFDITGVDWEELCTLMRRTGLGDRQPVRTQAVFAGSYACCFAWDQTQLIGCARAISDGVTSSAIYDVYVDPPYQGQGVGRALMANLLSRLPRRSVMLVSTHGNEEFYRKLGFRRLRTAYILQEDFGPWAQMGYLVDEPLVAEPISATGSTVV